MVQTRQMSRLNGKRVQNLLISHYCGTDTTEQSQQADDQSDN